MIDKMVNRNNIDVFKNILQHKKSTLLQIVNKKYYTQEFIVTNITSLINLSHVHQPFNL